MSEQEKQVETIQRGCIEVIKEAKEALINKQVDIAFNILNQAQKDMEADLINRKS